MSEKFFYLLGLKYINYSKVLMSKLLLLGFSFVKTKNRDYFFIHLLIVDLTHFFLKHIK